MRSTLPAILVFVSVIVLAHFFAPPGYVWTRNTISELASQGHTHKWIMQTGFIGFGLLLTGGLLWKAWSLGRLAFPDGLVIVYGLAILVTGIFCAAPFDPALSYSVKEAQIHSLFATLAGFALVAGMVGALILNPARRGFHLLFLGLVTGLSLSFGLAENGLIPVEQGIIQRLLYLVSLIWLASSF